MKQEIAQEKQHLAFIPDDRSPHGFVMLCKRWYLKTPDEQSSQDQVFRTVEGIWQEVREKMAKDLQPPGHTVGRDFRTLTGYGSPKRRPCIISREFDKKPPKSENHSNQKDAQSRIWSGSER